MIERLTTISIGSFPCKFFAKSEKKSSGCNTTREDNHHEKDNQKLKKLKLFYNVMKSD